MIVGSSLLKCALTDLGIQWAGWAVAAAFKTESFYDLAVGELLLQLRRGHVDPTGATSTELGPSATLGPSVPSQEGKLTRSGTFILLAHLSRVWGGATHGRQKVQTWLVTVWGLRLGTFLFMRILKEGHDRRFNNVRDSPGTFFVYWTIQAVWIFMTLLPTLMLNSEKRVVPLGARDYIGWTLWALGFATEAIADQQKWLFKRDPDNAGKFIQSGLWAYSRHPNYFGEILQWSGLWLSASSVMEGPQYLSVASPLFVWFLLRYVSGIPILEKQAMKRWRSEPAFQEYIRNTPLLWPWPKL